MLPQGLRYIRISFLSKGGYPVVEGALANAVLFEPLMISETTASAFKDQFIALFG
jgi:hypothetical protein